MTGKQHCYHVHETWTQGDGRAGVERGVCCFCGERGEVTWQRLADPDHGPYADVTRRVDVIVAPTGPCPKR